MHACSFVCTLGGWKDFYFFPLQLDATSQRRRRKHPHKPVTLGARDFGGRQGELCDDGAEAGNSTEPSSRVKTGRASHNCLPRPGSPARRWRLGGCSRPSTASAHMPGLLRDVLAICSCQPGLGPGLCAVAGDVPSRPAVATLPSCAPRHDHTAVSAPDPQNLQWGGSRASRSSLWPWLCLAHANLP